MRVQRIITENGQDYLVMSIPAIAETFIYAKLSKSRRSLKVVTIEPLTLSLPIKQQLNKYYLIDRDVMNGRMFSDCNLYYHQKDLFSHDFGTGILLPAIKIKVTKKFTA